ncbi:hypothetical protein F5Y13DRAFT_71202 [Hypoxylon sp. FL1857]|nr:hypothetical protein F5Y13DRAFT_71202 [Hypoxylon sp. FL1857]
MLFSKLYFATFLAGTFAAPVTNEKTLTQRDDYSIIAYSIGKEEKRATLPSDAMPVDKREQPGADGATYSIIVYSIGKEEKRETIPDQVYARMVEEAEASLAKRGEDTTEGAEYSIIAYSIGKEE